MDVKFFVLHVYSVLAISLVVSRLLESKLDFKKIKTYVVLLTLALLTYVFYFLTQTVIKTIILFQIYNFCHIYLFKSDKNSVNKITFATVFCFIIYLLCEIIGALSLTIFFKIFIDISKINAYTNNLIAYAIVTLFLILSNIKPIKRLLIKVVNCTYIFESHNLLFNIVYIMIALSTFAYLIFFNLSQPLKYVLFIFSLLEYSYLIAIITSSYKNKEKIQKDLELLLEITTKYEKVINDIKVKNHENKNQLVVLKGLVDSDNQKAIKYIDSLLKTNYDEDKDLIMSVTNVPAGGLKGLLYYKLLTMKSKKIKFHLEVDKQISKNLLNNVNIETLQKYYKIIGVFLDNAIEAVEDIKNSVILIEIYLSESNFVFSVANEVSGKIDFEDLGNKRITSKGENHGFGLQLVKSLLNESPDLFHNTELTGNVFIQKVGIKIKG